MDSLLPVQNRFCVTWSAQLIRRKKYSAACSHFCFRNEQYYFKLDCSDGRNFEIFLLPLDSVNANNKRSLKSFSVTVLLEYMVDGIVEYHALTTSKTIFGVPCAICNFKLFDNYCVQDYCEEVEVEHGYRYDANFVCFLEHLDETRELSTGSNYSSSLEDLSLDLGNLLKNGTLPDVKLKYGTDCTIGAHKALLAARSEVFTAMFSSKMVESETGIVDLGNMEKDVIDAFLQFVYTGKFPSGLSDANVSGLYATADKYAVHGLRDSCRDQMIGRLSEENCVDYLAVADMHCDVDFKHAVISFICRNEEILRGKTWLEFVKNPSPLAMEVYQGFVEHKAKETAVMFVD